MDRDDVIAAVRELYMAGEIEAPNVYYRLEHLLSAGQITNLIKAWQRDKTFAGIIQDAETPRTYPLPMPTY